MNGVYGTRVARYAYHGQGLDGTVGATIDLNNGDFIQTQTLGAIKLANGFDGTHAWMRDLSGAYSPQAGGNKGALAINEAYVRRSLKTAPIDRSLAIAYSRAGASAVAQVIPRDLIPPRNLVPR